MTSQATAPSTSVLSVDMELAFIALIATNVVLLAPISIYLLVKYRRSVEENDPYFTGRKPNIVLLQSSMAVIFISVYLPIHIYVFEIRWDNNNTIDECMTPFILK